jgi:hypothetical protein
MSDQSSSSLSSKEVDTNASGTPFINTCLFFPYLGETMMTWNLFADDVNDAYIQNCGAWLAQHGCNMVTFLLETVPVGEGSIVNFFKGSDPIKAYGGEIDMDKGNRLIYWLKMFKSYGFYVVPTIYCDDNHTITTLPWNRHEAFMSKTLPSINPYCDAYLIGCESNKFADGNRTNMFYDLAKKYTNLSVGTHIQWDYSASMLPSKIDFLSFEHPWHPKYGDSKSVQDCLTAGSYAIGYSQKWTFMLEWNVNPTGSVIVDQGKAMTKLPGCLGVGGPLIYVK